jgi:protein-S-isoprenylcysteine O-methyltransferase Ste14
LGNALVIWAMKVNAFFSNEVRIQSDRGQTVCDQGPYQFIRHPGYAGIIVYYLAMPIVLGSWLAMIPALITIILMVIRTILEDRMLHQKLIGYPSYSRKVRYRLIPHLW